MNIYRTDGLAVAANIAFLQLFRIPEDAPSYTLFDDPSTAQNGFRASFERARAGETVTVRLNQFDPSWAGAPGELIWYITTLFPFSAPDGSISFIGAVYQDISAQIRVEDERARLTAELAEPSRRSSHSTPWPRTPSTASCSAVWTSAYSTRTERSKR